MRSCSLGNLLHCTAQNLVYMPPTSTTKKHLNVIPCNLSVATALPLPVTMLASLVLQIKPSGWLGCRHSNIKPINPEKRLNTLINHHAVEYCNFGLPHI